MDVQEGKSWGREEREVGGGWNNAWQGHRESVSYGFRRGWWRVASQRSTPREMGVAELHDSCDGDAEIDILSVSNQYFSQVKGEELDRGWGSRKITA